MEILKDAAIHGRYNICVSAWQYLCLPHKYNCYEIEIDIGWEADSVRDMIASLLLYIVDEFRIQIEEQTSIYSLWQ